MKTGSKSYAYLLEKNLYQQGHKSIWYELIDKLRVMMEKESYNPRKIEQKWQKFWLDNKIFKCEMDSQKPKYYVLDMFPY